MFKITYNSKTDNKTRIKYMLLTYNYIYFLDKMNIVGIARKKIGGLLILMASIHLDEARHMVWDMLVIFECCVYWCVWMRATIIWLLLRGGMAVCVDQRCRHQWCISSTRRRLGSSQVISAQCVSRGNKFCLSNGL
jgi:hypothetical protein